MNGLTDQIRVGTEAVLPQPVTDDGHLGALADLVRSKPAAHGWGHPERGKRVPPPEGGKDVLGAQLVDLPVAPVPRDDVRQRALIGQVEIFQWRQVLPELQLTTQFRIRGANTHQSTRFRVREWIQHKPVRDAEHQRGRADTDPQGGHDQPGEERGAAERPQRDSQPPKKRHVGPPGHRRVRNDDTDQDED